MAGSTLGQRSTGNARRLPNETLSFRLDYGNGRRLAGGGSGWYALSTDGENWTLHKHPFITHHLTNWSDSPLAPVYSDLMRPVWLTSGFHCLAQGPFVNRMLALSPDGLQWHAPIGNRFYDFPQARNSGSVFYPSYGELTEVDNRTWLWGADLTVWQSDDWRWGATRVLPAEPGDFLAAAAAPDRVIALMDNGRVARSDDAVQWQFAALPGSGRPTAVVWADNRQEFLAAGHSDQGTCLWKSTDGAQWGRRSFPAIPIPISLVRGQG